MRLFFKDIQSEACEIFLTAGIDCIDEIELTSLDKDYYYYIDYFSSPEYKYETWYSLDEFFAYFNELSTKKDNDDLINAVKARLDIPALVYQHLATGDAHLIVDSSKEGYFRVDWYHMHKLFDILEENLTWITGDRFIGQTTSNIRYSFTSLNFWECATADRFEQISTSLKSVRDSIVNKKVKKYHNIFYNRRPRNHRFELMIELHYEDMLDDMIWSWGGINYTDVAPDSEYIDNLYNKKFKNEYKDSIDAVLSWDKLKNYKSQDTSNEIVLADLSLDDVCDTYYRLVTETYAANNNMFLTEKTYKSMLLLQPFVIWGSPYSIQTLRNDGYKTFDKWIDHSYDLIEDNDIRRHAVINEVKRLNSISKEEWAEMSYNMLPDLDYNLNHLIDHAARYSIDENFQITYRNTA